VKKDTPQFIGNRLRHALWREADSVVKNGVCDAAADASLRRQPTLHRTVTNHLKASLGAPALSEV
jgi:hypothetical protein